MNKSATYSPQNTVATLGAFPPVSRFELHLQELSSSLTGIVQELSIQDVIEPFSSPKSLPRKESSLSEQHRFCA